jgi:hypothetical protein
LKAKFACGHVCIWTGIRGADASHLRAGPGTIICAAAGVTTISSIFGVSRLACLHAFTGVTSKFIFGVAVGAIQGAQEVFTFAFAGFLGREGLVIRREASFYTIGTALRAAGAGGANARKDESTVAGVTIGHEHL